MSLQTITFDWPWLCISPAKQHCLVTKWSEVHRLSPHQMMWRWEWVMRRWESENLDCGLAVVLTPASTVNITKLVVLISALYSQDLMLYIDQCMAQWQIESLSALWWTVNGCPPIPGISQLTAEHYHNGKGFFLLPSHPPSSYQAHLLFHVIKSSSCTADCIPSERQYSITDWITSVAAGSKGGLAGCNPLS